MLPPLLIKGMCGLGDNILQRPFVRAVGNIRPVFLETPWPQLYKDISVTPVRSGQRFRGLRTQWKNLNGVGELPIAPSGIEQTRHVSYHETTGSYQQAMEFVLPLGNVPYRFDLPDYGPSPIKIKPIALVRPVTVRREWHNELRNPLPEYIEQIASRLMATHHVVLIADLVDREEWVVGPLPPHHKALLNGELSVTELMSLVAASDLCIGGIGWLTIAAIAYHRPVFTVLGGMGRHNSIERITDARMDLSLCGWAVPDRFCRCSDMLHNCDKKIANLEENFLMPKSPTIAAMKLAHNLHVSPLGPYHYKMIAESFIFDTSRIKQRLGWKPTLANDEMLLKAYEYYSKHRSEIAARRDVSEHRKAAPMGVIRLLKWVS